jgi:hypothetical protein
MEMSLLPDDPATLFPDKETAVVTVWVGPTANVTVGGEYILLSTDN